MSTFLEKYQSVVPVIQRIILQRGTRADLASKIPEDGVIPLTRPLYQVGRTDPKSHNEFQSMLYIDLAAAYGEAQVVDDFVGKTDSTYKRTIAYLRDGIARLRQRMEKYQHLIHLGEGASSVIFDAFVDASSKEVARKFYTTPPVLDADLDQEAEAITLPKVGVTSRIRSRKRKVRIARFEMDAKLGTQLSMNVNDARHNIEKAVDKDRGSFWAELVLSDQPIRIRPTWVTPIKEAYERLTPGVFTTTFNNGAGCKCHVMFQYKSFINRIILRPFSHGLMTLVACYSTTIDNDQIAFDRGEVTWLITDPVDLRDTHILNFPRHQAKRIYFIFQQPNYVRNTYHIPRIQKHNVEMWNRLAQAEAQETTDLLAQELTFEEKNDPTMAAFNRRNRALSQRKVDEVTGWSMFLDYAKRAKDWMLSHKSQKLDDGLGRIIGAMTSILSDKGLTVDSKSFSLKEIEKVESSLISVSALEYLYGLYDVEIQDIYFAPTGYFLSKAFKVAGRAVEFVLKHTASIPTGTTLTPYVSYNHNDTTPVWRGVTMDATGEPDEYRSDPIPVYWPDNSDFTSITEKFRGGKGAYINPRQTIYVHAIARAESVVLGGNVIHFNYSNPNRAYEPFPGEMVDGYVSQVKWSANAQPASPPANERTELARWAADLKTAALPISVYDNGISKLGATDDPSSPYYLSSPLPPHRIYYRPVLVTVREKGKDYVPDPYGENYFVGKKDFTMPLSAMMLLRSTLSGAIRGDVEITGHVEEDPMVGVKTPTGAEREISLTDISFFASDTDVDNRIKKWDHRIDHETTDSSYRISYDGNPTGMAVNMPASGVLILGIKKWLDDRGLPSIDQNIPVSSVQYVKPFLADKVIDGRYYDVVFPVRTAQYDDLGTQTWLYGNGLPAVNVKFESGLLQPLGGYYDVTRNKYPYVGFVAIKLDHFIINQPIFINPPLGIVTKNVTDYRSAKRPRLKKWNLDPEDPKHYPVIEYYHDVVRNKLQFAAQIPTEWELILVYATYAPDIRLKYVLTGTTDLSPIVEDFMIEVKEA